MNETPQVQPLSYRHRTWFFRFLMTIFFITVPLFIFYAIGYRIDFIGDQTNIVTVGGMFISSGVDETQIYVNEELINNYRLFQHSAYIQNLPAGLHHVHVQGEGLQTWVKDLPVYARIVTEAEAFNLPEVPQVRVVAPYMNSNGLTMIAATSSLPASGTVVYRGVWTATSSATSTLPRNIEYDYLVGRFASSTEEKTLLNRLTENIEQFNFSSDVSNKPISTTTATTTKILHNSVLYQEGNDIYVKWTGSLSAIPFYFCVPNGDATTTVAIYGQDIATAIASDIADTELTNNLGSRTCRDTIKIDTKDQEVYNFDFFPDNSNLIIVHREGGLFVTEVDDRSWQNSQTLYPEGDYDMLVDGGRIFIKENDIILELLTTLK